MIRYFYGFSYTADDQFDESGFEYFGEGSAVPQRPSPAENDYPAEEEAPPAEEEPLPAEEEPLPVEEELPPVVEELPPVVEEPCPLVDDANSKLAMHSLMLHAKVYIIADMYDIPCLKSEALQKFIKAQSSEWDASGFILAAEAAYNGTRAADSALRDSVVQGFMNNMSVLTDDRWKAQLIESSELLYDIARSLAAKGANVVAQRQYQSRSIWG